MGATARDYDLVVIGGGPGGYVAALRGAQRGLKTALIERDRVGGICLNWGCIPTKALLRSAHLYREICSAGSFGLRVEGAGFDYPAVVQRSRQVVDRLVKGVEFLLKRAAVEVITGHARVIGRDGEGWRVEIEAGTERVAVRGRRLILATGARARPLPGVPFDGVRVLSSRDVLGLTEVPRHVLIVGAGAIGMEFADILRSFGAEVTVVEMLPTLLPGLDAEVSGEVRKAFVKRGVRILTGTMLARVESGAAGLRCTAVPAPGSAGNRATPEPAAAGRSAAGRPADPVIEADCALVAIGLTGNVEDLGLEAAGIPIERGFLTVDGDLRTSLPNLYAIGDLAGPPLLAHKASAEGMRAADHAAGAATGRRDPQWIPAVVYTHPLVASVGLSEAEARAAEGQIRIGRFPMRASGRALAEGETGGFVKVILTDGGRLLGAQVVGLGADELIAELTLIGRSAIPAEEVLHTIHAHPTLAETIPEAFGAALGQGIHA